MHIRFLRVILFSALVFFLNIAAAQIPNSGFESWELDADGNLNPTGWGTTNEDQMISVDQYTPAKQGNYSMRVRVFDPGFFPINGIAFTEFAYTQRPSFFSVWLKTTVMPGDAVYVIVSLWKGDTIVASPDSCTFVIDSTINGFTHFSFPLSYQSVKYPDSANIMVIAGRYGNTLVGTEIIVDELAFANGVGLEENNTAASAQAAPAYPNPATGRIFIPLTLKNSSRIGIELYNPAGILLRAENFGTLDSGQHNLELSVDNLANGFYTYRLTGSGVQQIGKFTVRK